MILAETGGVEPNHSGPIRYYKKDTTGLMLHDVLFAPFFAGSAGAGMIWHWVPYVHANNLWFHYGRFAHAIEGIDPIKEHFVPEFSETDRLRIYTLKGASTTLLWLRDKDNNWKTELEGEVAPGPVELSEQDLRELMPKTFSHLEIYDPWEDRRSEKYLQAELPGSVVFKRSVVLRVVK